MKRLLTIAAVVLWAGVACAQSSFKYNGLSYTSTGVTFANLGITPPQTNGSLVYCSDCTNALPCAGGGNGAWAQRLNGSWNCLAGATGTIAANALISGQTGAQLNSLTGTGTTPNLAGFSVNRVINVQAAGATCAAAGGTDSSAAIQSALNTAKVEVEFPSCASGQGYNLNSLVTYALNTSGGIRIRCDSQATPIYVNNATGGLQISDTVGVNLPIPSFVIDNCTFVPVLATGDVGYAVDLHGLGLFTLHHVTADSTGQTHKFTVGIQLDGAQQGSLVDVNVKGNGTGLLLQDLSTTSSNQNRISHLYAANNTTGVDLEGGAAENTFNSLSVQANANGVINNQTTSGGGFTDNVFLDIEGEGNTVHDVWVKQDGIQLLGGGMGNNADTGAALQVEALGWVTAKNVNFNGSVAGGSINIVGTPSLELDWFEDNVINATYTNSGAAAQVILLNNRGSAVPATNAIPGAPATGLAGGLKLMGPTSGGAILRVPNAAGAPTITLPTTNGATGQVLQSDGGAATGYTWGPSIANFANLPVCNANSEGIHAIAANCAAACSAGTSCTATGSIHCEMYCNGAAYVETGR